MNTGSGNLDLVLSRLRVTLTNQVNRKEWNGLICEKLSYAKEIKKSKARKRQRQDRFGQLEIIGDAILSLALSEACLNGKLDVKIIDKLKSNAVLANIAKQYKIDELFCDDPSDSMEVIFGLLYFEKGLYETKIFILRIYSEKKFIPKFKKNRNQNSEIAKFIINFALRLYCLKIFPNSKAREICMRSQALAKANALSYIVNKGFNDRSSIKKTDEQLISELYYDTGFEPVLKLVTSALPKNANALRSFVSEHNPSKQDMF